MTPKAGRELDARVAVEVMGLEWRPWKPFAAPQGWFPKDAPTCNERDNRDYAIDADGYKPDLPMYSFSIEAAWKVVEKLPKELWPEIGRMSDGRWYCEIIQGGETVLQVGEEPLSRVISTTAPLAICLAALAAVGASE